MSEVRLSDIDAVELGELLVLVASFAAQAPGSVAEAFGGFIGTEGYALGDLAADCQRFAFLLGASDELDLGQER